MVSSYLVLWGGDMGCEGGSGTFSMYLTSVTRRFSTSRPLLISGEVLTEDLKGINTRFIESVAVTPNKHLLLVGSDYCNCKADEGNNFPANKFRYELAETQKGWKIVNKKLIGKNSVTN